MVNKKATAAKPPLLIDTTETEPGIEWLNSLQETEVRDRGLMDVFRRMQAEGVIDAFEKQAAVLIMPVEARRQLNELADTLWTKINIEFYSEPADAFFKALAE